MSADIDSLHVTIKRIHPSDDWSDRNGVLTVDIEWVESTGNASTVCTGEIRLAARQREFSDIAEWREGESVWVRRQDVWRK